MKQVLVILLFIVIVVITVLSLPSAWDKNYEWQQHVYSREHTIGECEHGKGVK